MDTVQGLKSSATLFGIAIFGGLLSGGPALSQDDELSPERLRVQACWESKDFDCAFENYATVLETPGAVEFCLGDRHHGCSYEIIGIYSFAVRAALESKPERVIEIARRTEVLISRMVEMPIPEDNEVVMDLFLIDASRQLGDLACVEEALARSRAEVSMIAAKNCTDLAGEWGVESFLDLSDNEDHSSAEFVALQAKFDTVVCGQFDRLQ